MERGGGGGPGGEDNKRVVDSTNTYRNSPQEYVFMYGVWAGFFTQFFSTKKKHVSRRFRIPGMKSTSETCYTPQPKFLFLKFGQKSKTIEIRQSL